MPDDLHKVWIDLLHDYPRKGEQEYGDSVFEVSVGYVVKLLLFLSETHQPGCLSWSVETKPT